MTLVQGGPFRLRVPGLLEEMGAGDMVHGIAEGLGFSPCGGCEERRRWLNEKLRLSPLVSVDDEGS